MIRSLRNRRVLVPRALATLGIVYGLGIAGLHQHTLAMAQNSNENFSNINEELNNLALEEDNGSFNSQNNSGNNSNADSENIENFSLNGNTESNNSAGNSENALNGNAQNGNAVNNGGNSSLNNEVLNDDALNNNSFEGNNNTISPSSGLEVGENQATPGNGSEPVLDTDPLADLSGINPAVPAQNLTQATPAPSGTATELQAAGLPASQFEKYDPQLRQFNDGLRRELQQRLEADLRMYCFDYCSVLGINVSTAEVFDSVAPDLGFDDSGTATRNFAAEKVTADVMVDVRYGTRNVERLKQLIAKLSATYPYPIEVIYSLIEMPDSDASSKGLAEVKSQFVRRVTGDLERLVRDFCPDECRVSDVQVQVDQASIDDLSSGAQSRYIHARGARGAVFVKGVSAALALNNEMASERRRRIEGLFREVLQPYGDINLVVRLLSYPMSASELERERNDPYGLEKLRQMLTIFKEFAGTKEIIKESELNSESSQSVRESQTTSNLSSSSTEATRDSRSSSEIASEQRSNFSETQSKNFLGLSDQMLYVIGGILFLLLLLGIIGARYVLSAKRVQHLIREGMATSPVSSAGAAEMMDPSDGPASGATQMTRGGYTVGGAMPPATALPVRVGAESNSDVVRALTIQRLKDELTQIFIRQPKVAREVFGRIIREDGVQQAAKCVAVFGEIVTFELLDDAELKDSLATLAEYVHRNVPHLDAAEELQLLESLKLRVSAGKIRVMADKGLGSFEFLKAKSPRQIYNLISDESAQSQSVVLTQLSKAKRNAVFDLFEGDSKIELLRALCQGRVVANDYLLSLSDALRRKAQRSGIFEQGLTSGVDVLLDLLAQSSLADQQILMGELDATNPEAARMVRSSLVTPETLQFIRDGLLIEIFLGLEAQILAAFLAGCPEHVRNMILSKVPQDMAQDWFDMMNSMPSIDSETYKVAELQILQKVRSFSESGMISLLEINQSIFPEQRSSEAAAVRGQRRFRISQNIVA